MYKHLTPMKPFYTLPNMDRTSLTGYFYRCKELRNNKD